MKNNLTRRDILKLTLASGLLSLTSAYKTFSNNNLKVLVLGGTNFLGPAIVKALIENGHQVTLFNRGKTNPHLFPDTTKIKGDRSQGKAGYLNLKNKDVKWDVVIDVWPQIPAYVDTAASILKEKANKYCFISSIAVYKSFATIGMDENVPLIQAKAYNKDDYSGNKVLCEKAVRKHFPKNNLILRPGAIVGDRDPGPFGLYLLDRLNGKEPFFAPDSNDPVQLIDADDIAKFLVHCIVSDIKGDFNLIGPKKILGYKDMIIKIIQTLQLDKEIYWMPPKFLTEEIGLSPFSDIPFWIPVSDDPEPGFYQISNRKAIKHGLTFSPFEKTVLKCLDSLIQERAIPEEDDSYFGIPKEKEMEILKAWADRH